MVHVIGELRLSNARSVVYNFLISEPIGTPLHAV